MEWRGERERSSPHSTKGWQRNEIHPDCHPHPHVERARLLWTRDRLARGTPRPVPPPSPLGLTMTLQEGEGGGWVMVQPGGLQGHQLQLVAPLAPGQGPLGEVQGETEGPSEGWSTRAPGEQTELPGSALRSCALCCLLAGLDEAMVLVALEEDPATHPPVGHTLLAQHAKDHLLWLPHPGAGFRRSLHREKRLCPYYALAPTSSLQQVACVLPCPLEV